VRENNWTMIKKWHFFGDPLKDMKRRKRRATISNKAEQTRG